jgi:DNA-binding NarL/FixJ family response regulator
MIRLIVVMKREQDLVCTTSGLNSQAGFTIVGIGTDSYEAIKLTESEQPDVAIIDYHLDETKGPELIPVMKRKCPCTDVIIISPYEDEKHAQEALINGAAGYLVQRSDMSMLASTVMLVSVGGCYVSHQIAARAIRALPEAPIRHRFHREFHPLKSPKKNRNPLHLADFVSLSRTEQRIIGFITQGRSTKEIAETLSLTSGTIRNYISTMMRKTGIHSRFRMAQFIQQKYPFSPEPVMPQIGR